MFAESSLRKNNEKLRSLDPVPVRVKEQKRKLGVAMAMIGPQKILFLDEPLTGLAMGQYLKQLKEKGYTVFFTTSSLEEAGEIADRVALISRGRLLAMGTLEYFTQEFSVGYQLEITPTLGKIDMSGFSEIEKIVHEVIPSARLESTGEVLRYLLPFGTQKNFEVLVARLTGRGDVKAHVVTNTLQELTMKIGKKLENREGGNIQNEIKISMGTN